MGGMAGRVAGIGVGVVMVVQAGTASAFSLFGIDGSYKVALGYSLAVRMGDPASELIDGPVDPLQPLVLPQPSQT